MGFRRSLAAGAVLLAGLALMGMGVGAAGAAASGPLAPVITEPGADNQLVSGADVHMETAPFKDSDPAAEHLCSDWEIWTASPHERVWYAACIGGVQRVHSHLGDGIFVNAFAGRADLLPDRDYELRVRHRDNSANPATEWSVWTVRPFRTAKERKPLPGAPQWLVKQAGYRVEEVAGDFQLPVNIAMVPGHSVGPSMPMFYVTELYGRIKVVMGDFSVRTYARDLLDFDPDRQFPGSGEMGLTGIVVDPASGDVFAAMLYKSGGKHYPKVVRFHSKDGGLTADSEETVLRMGDAPQEASHQISNLSIGPDGKLYVHMGDGFESSTAKDLDSFKGKILRVNLDGSAPSDNPFYDASDGIKARDYVFAYGFRNPFGGAWRLTDGQHYEVENGPSANDRLARVTSGGNYHWGGGASGMMKNSLYNWKTTHAPVNITFTEPQVHHASAFPPDKYGHAFVSESGPTYATGPQDRGKRVVEFSFNANGSVSGPKTLVEYNGNGKTTVAGLAAGPDGLYFTGLYSDSVNDGPTSSNAKIYRIRYIPPTTLSPLVVYAGRDFAGASQSLGTGVFDAAQNELDGVGNDKISSLRVAAGYRATVCANASIDIRGLGLCRYFGSGWHDFVGDDLNDKISLISVFAGPSQGGGVTAFHGDGFTGAAQQLGAGGYEAASGDLDKVGASVSSLQVADGYRAVVCDSDRPAGVDIGTLGLCRFFAPGQYATLGADLDGKISLVAVGGPAVTAYSDAGFTGQAQSFGPGMYEARAGQLAAVGNDAITSLRVAAGYRLVACANDSTNRTNRGDLGLCQQFPPGEYALAGAPLDNGISLLAVLSGPSTGGTLTAYRDGNFKGASSTLGAGFYGAKELGPVGNDAISSLWVAGGHRAVVCGNDSGTRTGSVGPCRFFAAGDHPSVGGDLNDKISLITVAR